MTVPDHRAHRAPGRPDRPGRGSTPMCNHRALTRWHKFWRTLARAYLIGFLVPEIYALLTVGPEATCSAWSWHSLGTYQEPCKHTPTSRAVIVTFCLWLAAHLGWGRFGLSWLLDLCRRIWRRNQEVRHGK